MAERSTDDGSVEIPPFAVGEEALQSLLQHITFQSHGLADHHQVLQATLMRLEKAHGERLERQLHDFEALLEQQCCRFGEELGKFHSLSDQRFQSLQSSFESALGKVVGGPVTIDGTNESPLVSSISQPKMDVATQVDTHESVTRHGSLADGVIAMEVDGEAAEEEDGIAKGKRTKSAELSADLDTMLQVNDIKANMQKTRSVRNSGLLRNKFTPYIEWAFSQSASTGTSSRGLMPPNRLAVFADSPLFAVGTATLIMLNTVFIGYETDVLMSCALEHPSGDEPSWLLILSRVFDVCFAVELLIRIVAFRIYFFYCRQWMWNVFDSILVIVSLLEGVGDNFLRLLRVWRIVRVVRIIRMLRFFRELRLLMGSLTASFWSLLWAVSLVGLFVFVFSILILQSLSYNLNETSFELKQEVAKRYKNLSEAMRSLLLAVSGGVEWEDIAAPLGKVSPVSQPLFYVYVIVLTFGVVNVITAVFVQSVSDLRRHDRDLAVQAAMADVDAFVSEMRRWLDEAGICQEFTFEELSEFLERDDAWAYMRTHDLEVQDIVALFQRLDTDSSGIIEVEDFVSACMELKGHAKTADVAKVFRHSQLLEQKLQMLLDVSRTNERVYLQMTGNVKAELSTLRADLGLSRNPMECKDME